MQRIFSISYTSRCLIPLEHRSSEISRLAAVATKNNAVRYVTALLTLQDDKFLQVIEGARDDIDRTFDSIRRDLRHTDVALVGDVEIPRRNFARWIFGLTGRSAEARAYFSESLNRTDLTSHAQLCTVLENLAHMDAAKKGN